MEIREYLNKSPIIAILRGIRTKEVEAIVGALCREGILIAEIPMNSPDPIASIRLAQKLFGQRMLIGAGTVTRVEDVQEIYEAGGRLIVSPDTCPDVIRKAKEHGLLTLPGIATPTEALTALRAGADGLKLFPADVAGCRMLPALRSVLPRETLILAVGGVSLQTLADWKAAGVDGYGIGSALYKPGDTAEVVTRTAHALMAGLGRR